MTVIPVQSPPDVDAAGRETDQAADGTRVGDAKVIVVIQRKGGAGKSTITVNLAAVSGESKPAQAGFDAPVVAVGIDPQGSMEQWARRVPEDALPFDYVVTKGRLGEVPDLLQDPTVRRIWVDTPGFMDTDPEADADADPLGDGRAADAMREVLALADLAIVPITTEFLTRDPAEFTIEYILKPRKIPFLVVVNQWDSARDRTQEDLKRAQQWAKDRGYPLVSHAVRKYKIHANAAEDGLTVIQYAENGTSLRARQDFYKLALAIEQAL
ncbi:ParA family protein [Kitasatospora sp. NPDC001132]